MALSISGSPACVAGTSIALPTHAVGDVIEIAAYRNGSNSVPTVPAAGGTVPTWVVIDNAGGANTNSMVVCRAVATVTNHTSGSWTNATHMGSVVYTGEDSTTPTGGHAQGGSAGSTGIIDLNLGAVTLSKTDGTSAIVRYVGARTVTAWGSAPGGWTLRASVASSGGIAILTKDSTTAEDSSGDSFSNTFSGNGGYRVQGVEVLALAGGATKDIAGSSAGVATASGAVNQTNAAVAGSSAGVATAAGSVAQTFAAVSGSSAGAATASGAVPRTASVAGSSAGAASCSGSVNRTASVSGSATGTATATGTLDPLNPSAAAPFHDQTPELLVTAIRHP